MAVRSTILAVCSALVLGSLIYVSIKVKAAPYEGTIEPTSAPGATRASHAGASAAAATGDDEPGPTTTPPPPRTRPGARSGSAAATIDRAASTLDKLGPRAAAAASAGADEADNDEAGTGPTPGDPTGSRAAEVSRLYDQREYDDAIKLAKTILETEPDNVRVMRVMISSACASGDVTLARSYFDKLKRPKDRRDMTKRCERFGASIGAAAAP
jgi:hypothetical protein